MIRGPALIKHRARRVVMLGNNYTVKRLPLAVTYMRKGYALLAIFQGSRAYILVYYKLRSP